MILKKLARGILVMLSLFLLANAEPAQNKTITGKVTDSKVKSVTSSTVTAKGIKKLTTNAADAFFGTSVSTGVLTPVISSIDFGSLKVSISGKEEAPVFLENKNAAFNEAAVAGYDAHKAKDFNKGQIFISERLIKGWTPGISNMSASFFYPLHIYFSHEECNIHCCYSMLMIACKPKGDYKAFTSDPILYSKTVKKLNNIVLENNFPPMIGARNYVYANIAAFECVAAGDPTYQTLSGQIKDMPAMPKPDTSKQIDFSLAALLAFTKVGNAVTFPEGSLMDYYNELKHKADSSGMPEDILENTIVFSDTIVATVMKWSKGDNYAATRGAEKYTVKDEDGRWVPTPPMFAIPRPPKFDVKNKSSVFYKAMMEVKNTGDSLTEEQMHIADFWDDNPFTMHVSGHVMFATKKFSPPGHWLNIVGIAAKTAKADFNTTVAAYTLTSIAFFDAFIRGWQEKYTSNYIRPETAISKYVNQEWRPYIQTPPFPSYVSGHATNSSAAAEAMTYWFGDKLSFTDTSLLEFGIKNREIHSFREAAAEAAMSRLYGGIHYRFDNAKD